MTITTSTGLTSFDQRYYQSLAETANTYFRESAKSAIIPAATTEKLDVDEYKKPIFGNSEGVYGEVTYGVDGRKMETPKSTKVHGLAVVRCNIYYGPNELKQEGNYVLQSKQDKIAAWMATADLAIWNGVYSADPMYTETGDGQGVLLADGLLTNAGAVVDLDGADSTLGSQGDVFKSLVKMVTSIPFRYRENNEIRLAMTAHFFAMANSATFTYDNGMTEWEQFFDKFIAKGVPGFKVSKDVIVSDILFGNLGDTLNTHDRLVSFVADPRVCERAYSRGISQLGQKQDEVGGVTEAWATKLGGCVHDANAFLLSEQIAWS
jgi:hypothetical protein